AAGSLDRGRAAPVPPEPQPPGARAGGRRPHPRALHPRGRPRGDRRADRGRARRTDTGRKRVGWCRASGGSGMTRKWIGVRCALRLLASLVWCAPEPARAKVLLSENFDSLPLRPTLSPGLLIASSAWSDVPPPGWLRDNTITPPGGAAEFFGWTFLSKSWW